MENTDRLPNGILIKIRRCGCASRRQRRLMAAELLEVRKELFELRKQKNDREVEEYNRQVERGLSL